MPVIELLLEAKIDPNLVVKRKAPEVLVKNASPLGRMLLNQTSLRRMLLNHSESTPLEQCARVSNFRRNPNLISTDLLIPNSTVRANAKRARN